MTIDTDAANTVLGGLRPFPVAAKKESFWAGRCGPGKTGDHA